MLRTKNIELRAFHIGRGKKWNALNMVPMRMAQKKIRSHWASISQERLTQSADASAGVKNYEGTVIQAYFDTGRIPTIPHRLRPWCGYGATSAPKRDLHAAFPPLPTPR